MRTNVSSVKPGVDLTVLDVTAETPDAKSIVLGVPPESAHLFEYRPGQFLTVEIPLDSGSMARCYSLSSAPGVDQHLQITVKRGGAGAGSGWLLDRVEPGMVLRSLRPAGTFTPRAGVPNLLLYAAGSGITPMMSIIKSVTAASGRPTILVYANRDADSIIFGAELAALEREHPQLRVVHWLECDRGLPSVENLASYAGDPAALEVLICGPSAFMGIAAEAARSAGVAADHVHLEAFETAAQNPFEESTGRRAPEDRPTGPGADLTVTLDGRVSRLVWPTDSHLVDVLLAAGLDAPYSCRKGNCSACAVVLLSGEVTMDANEVLDPADLADGLILGCQARPASESVEVTYDV